MIHVSPGTTRSDLAETARTAIVRALDL